MTLRKCNKKMTNTREGSEIALKLCNKILVNGKKMMLIARKLCRYMFGMKFAPLNK